MRTVEAPKTPPVASPSKTDGPDSIPGPRSAPPPRPESAPPVDQLNALQRIPRFGPAYVPPPEPRQPSGRGGIYLVLVLDSLLLAFAAAMGFGPWVPRPLSLYLAGAAVLISGTLACAAIAFQAAPHRPSTESPKPSRVRVRLTRL